MRTFYIELELKEWTIQKEDSIIHDPSLFCQGEVPNFDLFVNAAGYKTVILNKFNKILVVRLDLIIKRV